MNKYQKALHKLIKIDIKFSKEFEPCWNENYRFHKIACREDLKSKNDDTIRGINNLRSYIGCAFN